MERDVIQHHCCNVSQATLVSHAPPARFARIFFCFSSPPRGLLSLMIFVERSNITVVAYHELRSFRSLRRHGSLALFLFIPFPGLIIIDGYLGNVIASNIIVVEYHKLRSFLSLRRIVSLAICFYTSPSRGLLSLMDISGM